MAVSMACTKARSVALRIPGAAVAAPLVVLLGGLAVALISFADTSVLSRSLAQRGGYRVNQNQEMVALGVANLAAGLFQGFSVSSSASPKSHACSDRRSPVKMLGSAPGTSTSRQ